MPILRPLRALRYGPDHRVLLPKLISPATEGEPEDRTIVGNVHPLCIRQLVRGERGPLQGDSAVPFAHAARLLSRWIESGVVVRDPRPALYACTQEQGGVARTGLVALLRLGGEGAGRTVPHEVTLNGSTGRLLEQLREVSVQLSIVMAIVPDRQGSLASFLAGPRGRPILDVIDGHGVGNRVWRDEDPATQREILSALRDEPVVLADGHHRFDAALIRQRELRGTTPWRRDHAWDYLMALLVPASDPGLRSAPVHRVCPEAGSGLPGIEASVARWFEETPLGSEDALWDFLSRPDGVRFGLVRPGRRSGLILRDASGLGRLPAPLRQVDAAVAEELLTPGLAESSGLATASGSQWGHNATSSREVAARAFSGDVALALLLRPTPPGQVLDVALSGLLMPPKSTNFAPKPAKGLLMHSLVSF